MCPEVAESKLEETMHSSTTAKRQWPPGTAVEEESIAGEMAN